jgi:hypothetical protein
MNSRLGCLYPPEWRFGSAESRVKIQGVKSFQGLDITRACVMFFRGADDAEANTQHVISGRNKLAAAKRVMLWQFRPRSDSNRVAARR